MIDALSWQWLAIGAQAILVPIGVCHALLHKRDPRAAMGWIGLIVVFPLFGPLLYFTFGINRVRRRAQRVAQAEQDDIDVTPRHLPTISGAVEPLARVSDSVSDRSLVGGNRVAMLENGESVFPAMLEAIAAAEQSVHLMSYIMDRDEVGLAFVDALGAAISRGVNVKVLVDGVGERYSFRRISGPLRKAQVPVARFLPPRLIPPTLRLNLRNHRKVLLIDEHVAFTGGMNISKRHLVSSESGRVARDIHFRFEGPIASQLFDLFASTWRLATGEIVEPTIAASLHKQGDAVCRAINDGPDDDLDKLTQLLVGTVSAATQRVQIQTPYFLPPRELIGALQAASLRGVDVQIVLPAASNIRVVDWATRKMLWQLLERGVRVYYQPAPFHHGKLFVIDERYLLVSSANIDPRSLRLNFELGVEVFDDRMAKECAAYIDALAGRSRLIEPDTLASEPLPAKLRNAACWLFSPYL